MTHLGTSFSIFSQYIANGATYMVVFFMLSGFVIFLGHENSDWSNSKLLAYFYLRRLISIYPLYLFLHFTYEIVFRPLSVKENLLILPVELLGLQSFFSSLFSVSHNGGTWFVSCLLFCYFLFPLFELIVRGLRSKRSCLILCLLLYIILAIAPVVNYVFKTNSLYENPFFRSLEFLLGVLLAKIATTERPPVKWPAFLALVLFILHIVCALPGFVDSKNEEKTERNAGYLVVSHSGGGMLRQGTRKGIRRTPANRGMRAHWVVKGLDISEDVCHGMCP